MGKVVNLDEFSKPMRVRRSLSAPHRQVEVGLAREEEVRGKRK